MNRYWIAVLSTAVLLLLAFFLYGVFKGKRLANRLTTLLMEGKFDEFSALAISKEAQRYIDPFALDFLQLNAAIMKNDKKQVNELLDVFKGSRMNAVKKLSVASRAFYYFIANRENGQAQKIYDELVKEGIAVPFRMRYVYDTYCKKGYQYLEEIEEKLPSLKEEEKIEFYALLADMYKNKGDEASFRKYSELVKEKMKV